MVAAAEEAGLDEMAFCEHVFHIDTAGEPPQIAGGQAQLLRDDVFASAWFAQGTLKRPMTARQQMPVTFSGNENGFAG